MKVLIIEDDPLFSKYTKEILDIEGHETVIVDDADDALDQIEILNQYDVIILDIMMILGEKFEEDEAEETGVAIYKRIRKVNTAIPILVLSALAKADIWDNFSEDQHVAYIGKPIPSDHSQFITTLENLIQG